MTGLRTAALARRVEHCFSGAVVDLIEAGFSRWGDKNITSGAKARSLAQRISVRLKAYSTRSLPRFAHPNPAR